MFGVERASAKEITLFLLLLQGQGLAVCKTTKLETHVRMCSHTTSEFCKPHHYWFSSQTSNFSTIGQSVLEIWRWGVHVRTCRDTQLMTCIKTHSYWVSNRYHPLNFSTVRPAVPEIWKRGAHVRMHPTRDYCISCNLWVSKCMPNFNAIGPTVTE